MENNFAIADTKPGTTLTLWLNKFAWGGFIYSVVRSRNVAPELRDDQEWNQPALRFSSVTEAQAFILEHLAGNPEVRIVAVED